MGVGKTTIGHMLSQQYNIAFLDIDQHIEKITNQNVSSIFSSIGEKAFRKIETDTLRQAPKEDVVIATGGGIIEQKENLKYMQDNGVVIYLHNSFENLYKRIQEDKNRPLAFSKSAKEVEHLYNVRLPLYEKASHVIHTNNRSITQVVDEIIALLTKLPPSCK
jgi:shikimate kinase